MPACEDRVRGYKEHMDTMLHILQGLFILRGCKETQCFILNTVRLAVSFIVKLIVIRRLRDGEGRTRGEQTILALAFESWGKLAASEDGDMLRKISFKSATLEK